MPKTPFIFDPQTIHGNLDERFYRTVNPASFPDHIIRYRNQDAASTVGLADLSDDAWRDHFGRFVPFKGSFRVSGGLLYNGNDIDAEARSSDMAQPQIDKWEVFLNRDSVKAVGNRRQQDDHR